MKKFKLKNIVVLVVSILAVFIIGRLVYVHYQQKNEFDYHKNIPCTIKLWSANFNQNGLMPAECTGQGKDFSPELRWSNLPEGTRSIAIVVTDYDAPSPNFKIMTIDHWILFNLDAQTTSLPKAVNCDSLIEKNFGLGKNITGGYQYVGPNPPFGVHNYYFRIYALSIPHLNLAQPTKEELLKTIKPSILAYGELVGRYEKR